MGFEAGEHRGNFLDMGMNTQIGTMALVPQTRLEFRSWQRAAYRMVGGMAAALVLGAAAEQCGTAYLFNPRRKYRRCIAPLIGGSVRQYSDNERVHGPTRSWSGEPRDAGSRTTKRSGSGLSDRGISSPLRRKPRV